MKTGSLFSGIGGLDLGLERAGFQVAWQCEEKPYARTILRKHWPAVPCHTDVRLVSRATVEPVQCVVGGFPCQGVSGAGHRLGLEDPRSGLWREFYRVICDLRPDVTIVENVGQLSARGLESILGDLAEGGFSAEWASIPASLVGALHQRERLFIIAYPAGFRLEGRNILTSESEVTASPLDNRRDWPALSTPLGIRSTHGFPGYVDRITGLGNAVVPQVAEWIGRRIMKALEN